jgi:hypothetical protein
VPVSKRRKTKNKPEAGSEYTPKEPVRLDSPAWIAPAMVTCFLLGLGYVVIYYLAGQDIPLMRDISPLINVSIGFAFVAVGFFLATKWR